MSSHLVTAPITNAPPAIPITVATDNLEAAAKLLHQFDALALGEGDLAAGANTLAAMALALSCVAPPGSCVVGDSDGTRIPVGMGMLLSGALSCDIVDDRVLGVLRDRQNHLYGHVRQWLEKNKLKEQRAAATGAPFANREVETSQRSPFERLENPEYAEFHRPDDNFRDLLRPPQKTGAREIREQPLLFASVGSAEGLASVLDFANSGRPLVHTALSDDGDHALLARVCSEVMSGCPKRSLLSGSISGQVIATDPFGMLGGLLCKGGKGTGWLQRLLWLSDHATGPAFELPNVAATGPQLRRLGELFECAIESVAAKRLNFRMPEPMRVRCEFGRGQAAWNAFLHGLEPRFPGITGTLRPLPASLVFGLLQMTKECEDSSRPQLAMDDVVAFARLLALRMVNARELMLHEGRSKRLDTLATNIRLKLADGPLSIRDLTRKSNRLNAATCQEVLERLAESGLVVRTGSRWQLTALKQHQTLTLNV